MHEGYHCISASKSALDEWGVAARETIADVGAVNKALTSGIKVDNLIAMADWRAIRFASGIADVVAGRINGKDIYFRASPAHMSTLAIKRLLATGPVDTYEQIQKLALSNTFQGLYGEKKQAQRLLTRILLLYKNLEIRARFPNATIQDADDILSFIGAPQEIVETVRDSVSRYLSKLDCRSSGNRRNNNQALDLVCRQSDNSFIYSDTSLFGPIPKSTVNNEIFAPNSNALDNVNEDNAKLAFIDGRKVNFPSHVQYHLARQ